jgi:TRAP-type C4-dicarboxylate transport system permease small subunit
VPVWLTEAIIPFGFLVMAVRFLVSAVMPQKLQVD